MREQMLQDLSVASAKAAPPAAVSAYAAVTQAGINWWVAAATLAYIVLQGAYLIWKWRKEANKK